MNSWMCLSALCRPPAVLHWICPPAQMFCRSSWSMFTQTTLQLSKVTFAGCMCWINEDLEWVLVSNILDQNRAIEFLTLSFFFLSLSPSALVFLPLSHRCLVLISLSLTLPQSPHLCVTYLLESQKVEFVCNVLVVADQLLIPRLKEMCEVAVTENRESAFLILSP